MLGVVGAEGAEHAGQLRVRVRRGEQPVHHAAHLGGVAALQVLQLVFEAAAGRQADDRRQVEREDHRRADLLQRAEHAADDRLHLVARRRSADRTASCRTTTKAALDWLPPSSSEKPTIDSTFWICGIAVRDRLDPLHHFARPGHAGAVRQLDRDEERALVLLRQEPGRRALAQHEDAAGADAPRAGRRAARRAPAGSRSRRSRCGPGRCRARSGPGCRGAARYGAGTPRRAPATASAR